MQSKPAKIIVAVGSIALIVILFVVLSGGDDETPSGDGAEVTTTTHGHPEEGPDGPGHEGGDAGSGKDEGHGGGGGKAGVPAIVVSGGEPEGGVARLEFDKGEEIAFSVESDVAEEIHVHGYDIYGDLEPGKPAKFGFPAEIDGVFEVEMHGTGVVIAELSVKP